MHNKCSNKPYLALMQTAKAVQERMKLELAKDGLSITEFSVLEVLYLKERQTIQQIGSSILITSGSMTYVIDKLEQRGLLKRSGCPNDRRAIYVALTEQGMNVMKQIMPKHQRLTNDFFASLNPDEADTFIQLLEKVKMRTVN
jgi:MarR family 2-MHQ and catechol resistance regulon transcriptional repressor